MLYNKYEIKLMIHSLMLSSILSIQGRNLFLANKKNTRVRLIRKQKSDSKKLTGT